MKALIAREGFTEPRLEEAEPAALAPGELRVAVVAAPVNLVDTAIAATHGPFPLPEAVGLGWDLSGTVVEVGAEATGFAVGDRVAGMHARVAAPVRAHATETVLLAEETAPLPDGLDLETAALVPVPALTARQALDLLGDQRGTLLVTGGTGGVGSWAIALAARDGWSVTGYVRAGREQAARAVGADDVTTELTPGEYDAVFDAANLQEPALAAVRDGGRFVGVSPAAMLSSDRGVDVSAVSVHADSAALAGLLGFAATAGGPLLRVAGRSPLADASAAYAKVAAGGLDGRWLLLP